MIHERKKKVMLNFIKIKSSAFWKTLLIETKTDHRLEKKKCLQITCVTDDFKIYKEHLKLNKKTYLKTGKK